MVLRFIQCPLMISLENVNLDKTKIKNLINSKSKYLYILFYTLWAIFSIITKN